MHMCHDLPVDITRQPSRLSSFLLLCKSWGSKLTQWKTWQQEPLPTEPSYEPPIHVSVCEHVYSFICSRAPFYSLESGSLTGLGAGWLRLAVSKPQYSSCPLLSLLQNRVTGVRAAMSSSLCRGWGWSHNLTLIQQTLLHTQALSPAPPRLHCVEHSSSPSHKLYIWHGTGMDKKTFETIWVWTVHTVSCYCPRNNPVGQLPPQHRLHIRL